MARDKLSRLQVNKVIRQALVKNSADLTLLQFSCQGRSLTLNGTLKKQSGGEYTAQGVESLIQDIQKIGLTINSDLSNWEISNFGVRRKGTDRVQKKINLIEKTIKKDKIKKKETV